MFLSKKDLEEVAGRVVQQVVQQIAASQETVLSEVRKVPVVPPEVTQKLTGIENKLWDVSSPQGKLATLTGKMEIVSDRTGKMYEYHKATMSRLESLGSSIEALGGLLMQRSLVSLDGRERPPREAVKARFQQIRDALDDFERFQVDYLEEQEQLTQAAVSSAQAVLDHVLK